MAAVSVILPTHNRMGTLPRAIGSVLGQSYADLELIVVDDASSDGTQDWIKSVGDPRLRYLRLEKNRGAAGARNAGIAAAQSEWIAFQDSDDQWLPHKLEQQMGLARSAPPTLGLILTGYTAETSEGPVEIRPAQVLAGLDPMPDILDGWPIITPTWLVRRRLLQELGGFDETLPCLEDWDLVFRLSELCAIGAVAGPGLVKSASADSVCTPTQNMRLALTTILERHGQRWQGQPLRLARRLAHLGTLQVRLGQGRAGRSGLRRAIALAPSAWPLYGLLLAALAGPRVLNRAARWWPQYAGMAL